MSPRGPALRHHHLPAGPDPVPLPPTLFPLPADPCYSPLGVASLPDSSFSASAAQEEHLAPAARLHRVSPGQELQGWAPPADVFPGLPSQPPFLQLDLLQPTNLTGGCCVPGGTGTAAPGAARVPVPQCATSLPPGVVLQGAGAGDAFVTAFQLQFSTDGTHWHDYRQVSASSRPEPKVLHVCTCVCECV